MRSEFFIYWLKASKVVYGMGYYPVSNVRKFQMLAHVHDEARLATMLEF